MSFSAPSSLASYMRTTLNIGKCRKRILNILRNHPFDPLFLCWSEPPAVLSVAQVTWPACRPAPPRTRSSGQVPFCAGRPPLLDPLPVAPLSSAVLQPLFLPLCSPFARHFCESVARPFISVCSGGFPCKAFAGASTQGRPLPGCRFLPAAQGRSSNWAAHPQGPLCKFEGSTWCNCYLQENCLSKCMGLGC